MRTLPQRPTLPETTTKRMQKEADAILASSDQKQEAERRHNNARKTIWYASVVKALKDMSGVGERCMFCSGSESSQVEHFKPKAVFPEEAMMWDNLLWVCGICNQSKGDRFPPYTGPGGQIIDPTIENVWDFFFIDEYGNLTPKWRTDLNSLDPRAKSTVENLALDRDALQQTRQQRIEDLKVRIEDSLSRYRAGELSRAQLEGRCREWRKQPFQPDVADYFLAGPGKEESPFREFLVTVGV